MVLHELAVRFCRTLEAVLERDLWTHTELV